MKKLDRVKRPSLSVLGVSGIEKRLIANGTCGIYYKHIMIVNDDFRVMLQTVASLTRVIDAPS